MCPVLDPGKDTVRAYLPKLEPERGSWLLLSKSSGPNDICEHKEGHLSFTEFKSYGSGQWVQVKAPIGNPVAFVIENDAVHDATLVSFMKFYKDKSNI